MEPMEGTWEDLRLSGLKAGWAPDERDFPSLGQRNCSKFIPSVLAFRGFFCAKGGIEDDRIE